MSHSVSAASSQGAPDGDRLSRQLPASSHVSAPLQSESAGSPQGVPLEARFGSQFPAPSQVSCASHSPAAEALNEPPAVADGHKACRIHYLLTPAPGQNPTWESPLRVTTRLSGACRHPDLHRLNPQQRTLKTRLVPFIPGPDLPAGVIILPQGHPCGRRPSRKGR